MMTQKFRKLPESGGSGCGVESEKTDDIATTELKLNIALKQTISEIDNDDEREIHSQ